jgi:hypothetical protein
VSDDIQRLAEQVAGAQWHTSQSDEERAAELVRSFHAARGEHCRIDTVVAYRDDDDVAYMVIGEAHLSCDRCGGHHWHRCHYLVMQHADGTMVQCVPDLPRFIDPPDALDEHDTQRFTIELKFDDDDEEVAP